MRRNISRFMALVMVAVTVLSLCSFAAAGSSTMYATAAVNVRSGPGTGYAILGSLEKNQAVTATGTKVNGWTQIQYSKYELGYVASNYLSTGCTPAKPISAKDVVPRVCSDCGDIYYATTALNVRSGPGTKYGIIGGLNKNQQVTRIGKSGNWYKILTVDGRDAYASASYLKLYRSQTGTGSSSTAGSGKTYYATTGLNMRKGPGTGYSVVYTLNRGEAVTYLGTTSGKWMMVRSANGKVGYCHSAYLTTQGISRPTSSNCYYCSECGKVVYYRDQCNSCGENFNWNCGYGAVKVGEYYKPNYKTYLYNTPSASGSVITTVGTDDVLRVESYSSGSGWALVRIKDTATYGYVPVDAIR